MSQRLVTLGPVAQNRLPPDPLPEQCHRAVHEGRLLIGTLLSKSRGGDELLWLLQDLAVAVGDLEQVVGDGAHDEMKQALQDVHKLATELVQWYERFRDE